jgi:two-component sensor histidine kinase
MSLARDVYVRPGAIRGDSDDLLIDALPAAIVVLGRGGRILQGNPMFCGMCHVSSDRVVGKRLDALFDCEGPNSLHRAVLVAAHEGAGRVEADCVLPDVGVRTLSVAARLAGRGGSYPLIAILQDVTDERATERDRTRLQMAEVAHRVKNSLQILASSVSFQQRRASVASDDGYQAVQRRILAIASLYDVIARSGEQGGVDGRELLLTLAESLRQSLLDESSGIEIVVDATPWPLTPRTAEALGLIINELATNAIKHGFDGGGGVMTLSLRGGTAGLVVEVTDDGCGIASAHQPGVGSAIVKSLVSQLHAQMVRKTGDDGTKISLTLPPPGSLGACA